MFIRETVTRRVADKVYKSFRLVTGIREGKKIRQKTLLNLGSSFSIPKDHWPELVRIIKERLDGTLSMFEPDPVLATEAESILRRLRSQGLEAEDTSVGTTAEVVLDSIECEDVRSAGCERIAHSSLVTLGLLDILTELDLPDRDARIAMALVIARMVHPSSEREALRWLVTTSATLELVGLETGPELKLDKLYRISDALQSRHHAIEDALFRRQRDILGTSGAVMFYDLTNTYMTGRPSSPLARYGRSKQKRHDCPLVTLALATDGRGFPRRSCVLPGNVSEAGTLAEALDSLATGDDPGGKPTVIMDAGISTKATLSLLRERGHHWITVHRSGITSGDAQDLSQRDADATLGMSSGHDAHVWRLTGAGDGEIQLGIWSQARQAREDAILARKREEFESELAHLHAGLSKKGYVKRYDRVLERIGRLRERYSMVNTHYDITIKKGEKGLASSVTWTRNSTCETRDSRAGLYVLRTSHTDWDLERVVRTYWRLTELEATFASLKSELGLRPVWHQKSRRIAGHLFIAVLAIYGVTFCEARLASQGIHDSWTTVRRKLARWQRVTTTFSDIDGSRIEVRHDARPDPEACLIGRSAGVPWGPERRSRKLRIRQPG